MNNGKRQQFSSIDPNVREQKDKQIKKEHKKKRKEESATNVVLK